MNKIGFSLIAFGWAMCGMNSNAQTVSGQVAGYDYVDLGLSVKWATRNLGAASPTEPGSYFAWGETEPKENYKWENYKWCKGTFDSLTRYCVIKKLGKRDKTTELIPNDDAATANWGPDWRMPNVEELQALIDSCKWEWTNDYNKTGVAGTVGTSKINGNTIFLPAAGSFDGDSISYAGKRGQYLSRKIADYEQYEVFSLWFGTTSIENDFVSRYIGNSIRPVTKPVTKYAKKNKKR